MNDKIQVRADASFSELPESRKLKWDFSCCNAVDISKRIRQEASVFKTREAVKAYRKAKPLSQELHTDEIWDQIEAEKISAAKRWFNGLSFNMQKELAERFSRVPDGLLDRNIIMLYNVENKIH